MSKKTRIWILIGVGVVLIGGLLLMGQLTDDPPAPDGEAVVKAASPATPTPTVTPPPQPTLTPTVTPNAAFMAAIGVTVDALLPPPATPTALAPTLTPTPAPPAVEDAYLHAAAAARAQGGWLVIGASAGELNARVDGGVAHALVGTIPPGTHLVATAFRPAVGPACPDGWLYVDALVPPLPSLPAAAWSCLTYLWDVEGRARELPSDPPA